jgi:transposase InsO family protein
VGNAAKAYTQLFQKVQVRISMVEVGATRQNGYVERLIQTIKEVEVRAIASKTRHPFGSQGCIKQLSKTALPSQNTRLKSLSKALARRASTYVDAFFRPRRRTVSR